MPPERIVASSFVLPSPLIALYSSGIDDSHRSVMVSMTNAFFASLSSAKPSAVLSTMSRRHTVLQAVCSSKEG